MKFWESLRLGNVLTELFENGFKTVMVVKKEDTITVYVKLPKSKVNSFTDKFKNAEIESGRRCVYGIIRIKHY